MLLANYLPFLKSFAITANVAGKRQKEKGSKSQFANSISIAANAKLRSSFAPFVAAERRLWAARHMAVAKATALFNPLL